MSLDRRNVVVVCVSVLLGLLLVVGLGCWSGVRVTEADRKARTLRYESCLSIENEGTRALCLTK